MATYQVVHKYIYRASTVDIEMGKRADGSPNIVRQNGPLRRVEVGELLEDLSPEDVASMHDRLVLIPEEHVEHVRALAADPTFRPGAGVHEPQSGPGDRVQKPPLTPEQAVTMKAAEAELRKVDADMDAKQREMDLERQAARNQAYTAAQEQAQAEMQAQAQQRRGAAQAARPAERPQPRAQTPPTPPAERK